MSGANERGIDLDVITQRADKEGRWVDRDDVKGDLLSDPIEE